ncbi:murein hydrolase activator EnvC family protein, partial [Aerolutibacter daejeonensis]|uniref:murein hydrolase activator EnvC family protein n=1 Tax=Aerolutibacter daejeonensis TaxID=346181 RepID=UPI000564BCC8
QVGGLGWPVAGALLAGFGATMPDGRRSDGLLIGAGAGNNVSAVADGDVVYAEWMTGYGLLLIVDHGNGYMSLYAHNDALLRDVGDHVRKGQPVATVGSSGGHGRPALYFELRRNGQPVNPGVWLRR